MTNAAITPGTQPISVRINTMIKEPHPLSITASGGKIIHNNTLQIDIVAFFLIIYISCLKNSLQIYNFFLI